MPPQRRNPGPGGPPRRRPKVAGASHPRRVDPALDEDPDASSTPRAEDEPGSRTEPETRVPAGKSAPDDVPDSPAPFPVLPEAPDASPAPSSPAPQGESPRRKGGWLPVAVIAAVAVVLAVVAGVAAFRPGADVSNRASVDDAATREVTEAARVAIETMHGYDYRTIDDDFARIRELLTEERLAEFDSTAEVTKNAAVQTRTVTEVEVLHIGTSMLDDSHAEVAAYINVSATGEGIAQGSAAAPLLVRLDKSDGRWLVSEIRDQ